MREMFSMAYPLALSASPSPSPSSPSFSSSLSHSSFSSSSPLASSSLSSSSSYSSSSLSVPSSDSSTIKSIPLADITICEDVGKGPYWVVKKGKMIPPFHPSSREKFWTLEGFEFEKEDGQIVTSVKVPKEFKEPSTVWETYFANRARIHHPNIIHFFGVCSEKIPPWSVTEIGKEDLYSALTDPHRFIRHLDKFSTAFDRTYTERLFAKSDSPSMRDALRNEIDLVRRSIEAMAGEGASVDGMKEHLEKLLVCGERHWSERTGASHSAFSAMKNEVWREREREREGWRREESESESEKEGEKEGKSVCWFARLNIVFHIISSFPLCLSLPLSLSQFYDMQIACITPLPPHVLLRIALDVHSFLLSLLLSH